MGCGLLGHTLATGLGWLVAERRRVQITGWTWNPPKKIARSGSDAMSMGLAGPPRCWKQEHVCQRVWAEERWQRLQIWELRPRRSLPCLQPARAKSSLPEHFPSRFWEHVGTVRASGGRERQVGSQHPLPGLCLTPEEHFIPMNGTGKHSRIT